MVKGKAPPKTLPPWTGELSASPPRPLPAGHEAEPKTGPEVKRPTQHVGSDDSIEIVVATIEQIVKPFGGVPTGSPTRPVPSGVVGRVILGVSVYASSVHAPPKNIAQHPLLDYG